MAEPLVPGSSTTYEETVRVMFEKHVFPSSLSYKGHGVDRDNVIVEEVDRDGNSWWLKVRARYSGKILGIGVAERARVHYDNGQISVDLGGCHGVLNTEGIANWLNDVLGKHPDSGPPAPGLPAGRVFIKSAHGEYFLNHRTGDRLISLESTPYDPATGNYDGELWRIVDAGNGRVFIKSAHGEYFLNHRIADRLISLESTPYNPATGAYDGELWHIVDAGNGRVFIKSAHGEYFLNHRIADRLISLESTPYNPATGAYDGELWRIVAA
jgi:hypothetical protein